MIPVSEISARLTKLMADPPIREAGRKAAVRAAAQTNSQLAQARLPVRVSVQADANRVHFTYAATGPVPSNYHGPRPADVLRRNLSAELDTARRDAAAETKRMLSS
jgi:hypothetical protein